MSLVVAESSVVIPEAYFMANVLISLLIAFVVILLFLAFFVVIMKWIRNLANKEEHYCFAEMGALRKTAEVLGIDINYEKKLLDMQSGKTFRRKLEERIIADTFGDEEPEKKVE